MSSTLRFAIIALMLLTAGALGMIILNMTRSAPTPVVAQVPAPLMVNQLVAARPIPAGTLVRDDDFIIKPVRSTEITPNSLTDTPENRANLRGSLIRSYINAGMPITLLDVLQPRDRGFIASVLRAGARAVAVGVDPVSGVAGLIWPGDHVDILLTQEIDGFKSLAVLTDVRVIAIDQDMVQSAPANNAVAGKIVRTVTVEVDPLQAQKLAVAEKMGKLSLAIRAAADSPTAMMSTVWGADISPRARPSGVAIQVFNGVDHKEMIFK